MKQLRFVAPTLVPTSGRPVTIVQNGEEWANLEQHEQVEVWVCKSTHLGNCPRASAPPDEICKKLGVASITLPPWVGTFMDVPARLLDRHHCGPISYADLREWMESTYGESFGVFGKVTVIDFMIIRE